MEEAREALWTIDELGSRVALALSVDYEGQASGRVREVPDRRTIRYYTTLGLIDRPAALRGRTALYGRRHLLQLVAIKRLQAKGLALAELQHHLVGQSDDALAEIAHLSEGIDLSAGTPECVRPATEGEERSTNFWKTAPPATSLDQKEVPTQDLPEYDGVVLQGIRLASEVSLLLPVARSVEPDDLEAIQAAAAPLLKLLELRRLVRVPRERE